MNTTKTTRTPPAALLDPALRTHIATADTNTNTNTNFLPYTRYGITRDDMEYLPLPSPGTNPTNEIFLIRFNPGATSTPHEHTGGEAFYVLQGEITDCDGTTFKRGDYICYQPGSRHFSASPNGCTLLVILGGENRAVSVTDEDN